MYYQCDFRKLGGDDFVRLWINRKEKSLYISSIKTNYSRMKIRWSFLFDSLEEEADCQKMSEEEFKSRLDQSVVKKIIEAIPSRARQANNLNESGGLK